MCLRAELGAVVADKTVLKMMREMGIRCGIRRRGYRRRYSSYRGLVGTVRERHREGLRRRGAMAEDRHRRHRVQGAGAKAYWAPVLDFCTKEIVAATYRPRRTSPSSTGCSTGSSRPCPTGRHRPCTRTWAGSTSTRSYTSRLEGAGIAQSMSRKGNCVDNAGTEQLFGHVKDEFYRGREWGELRGLQARPGGVHRPLEHAAQAGKIEGPDAGGVRNRALAA